ncbi:IS701 family transposase [Deinococcus misasensis]|uniref:IS701 family transposase n=1 Tax=Deinococcus misasensis TaxID=392413 RepID=UPI00068F135B|nr:IS701 family transposase [Deinococcus misasensis]
MRHFFPHWSSHFPQWFQDFETLYAYKAQRHWAATYIQGLCSPAHRKSMQPLSELVAPGKADCIQHFITDSQWKTEPLQRLLAKKADQLLGGERAVLIIDDTCLTKFGRHSVGVARQYSGQVGKLTNCQCLVSLTLARDEISVPVALRLFLPREWTEDLERCQKAKIPSADQEFKPKWQLALEELDQLKDLLTFGVVLADAAYGANAQFRHELTLRGLKWSVGVPRTQKVYPKEVEILPLIAPATGRPPKYPSASHGRETIEDVLARETWHHVVWRQGTKGPLMGRFAACYVCLADGQKNGYMCHLPGERAWIVGEDRGSEKKYYVCNLPEFTSLQVLVEVLKKRWACELSHRELKQEVGLSHFEGRFWYGLRHHAVLCIVALLFLQTLRLKSDLDVPEQTVPAIRALVAEALKLHSSCFRCSVRQIGCRDP